ncbi:hypothetical protein, conserved [Plasmodium gonderi]|uniref:RNA-binding protein n=1 Tax=Plasmodium gonderi TaxID=77519 RepID=A0A1Y1JLW6_PLAGO|nr:hypothetical protein, conserved [Plasmodium gonderi]GAW83479.1 hypothetical protein, conserved [Plasmodium gonderi]
MIFTKICFLLAFLEFIVYAFVKHTLTFDNYIYHKTGRFRKKKKKINYRLRKSKDEDTESYIPYIYKDIASSLKDLADEEHSYKQLLNTYFPETIEREIKKKKEKELRKRNEKNNFKSSEEKENKKDIDKIMEEKLAENNITNFEHISKINDHKKKNKILDIAYDTIEDSLKDIYFNMKSSVDYKEDDKTNFLEIAKREKDMLYEELINRPAPINNNTTLDLFGVFYDDKDYADEKKLLAVMNKMLNLEPFKSNKGNVLQTVDTLLKKNKLPIHIRNFLLKYRRVAEKFTDIKEEITPEGIIPKSVKELSGVNDDTHAEHIERGSLEGHGKDAPNDINIGKTKKDQSVDHDQNVKKEELNETEQGIKSEDFFRDVNKVIMTLHNNLNKEKLIRKDQHFVDELYEAYKKHLRCMHIKRNKLEPQKNNYDFLAFVHEHFEEYFFFKYGNFDYNFNERVQSINSKMKSDKSFIGSEQASDIDGSGHGKKGLDKKKKGKVSSGNFHCASEFAPNPTSDQTFEPTYDSTSNPTYDSTSNPTYDSTPNPIDDSTCAPKFEIIPSTYNNELQGINWRSKRNPNKECGILKGIKEHKNMRKHVLVDIIQNYEKRMYDIYKPNDAITNMYGFNNYIDNEQYDKEINISFNKYSILNYDSKEELNKKEKLYVGKLIFGKIFKIEKTFAYVDINYAFYAELHEDQMPYNIKKIKNVFQVNDKLIFEIYKMYPNKILLTLKNIQKVNDLNRILHFKTQDIPFEVQVITVLKNGISVSYNDIYTFIHISSISSKYKTKIDDNEKIDESLVKKKIKVICTDINKLNFSNLIYEQNEQLKKMNIYDIINVEIIHISKYGLMVKCDDIVGLIHISEISKKKIDDLNGIFKIGDQLKGILINIDYDNKRFSLSTKILEINGKNFIDHRTYIYDNMQFIANDIKKRNTSLRINDSNIKNQLLSLIDIYKTEENDTKNDKKANTSNLLNPENPTGAEQTMKTENSEVTKMPRKEFLVEDAIQGDTNLKEIQLVDVVHEQNNNVNKSDTGDKHNTNKTETNPKNQTGTTDLCTKNDHLEHSARKKGETEEDSINMDNDESNKEKKELTIDVHNQLIPYLMMKQDEITKAEKSAIEQSREIVWNLDDDEFLHSNSPTNNTQFFEYQWSYLKDKKWVNFSYYVNRIMNYYFNINDDYFTYKEKNMVYEIDFVKNIRIDLSTGLYNKIRKITK